MKVEISWWWVAAYVVALGVSNCDRDRRIDALEHDSVEFYRAIYGPLDGGAR